MKVIALNAVTAVYATSENPNFPAANLLDKHPKKPWKVEAGIAEASLTVDTDALSNGLGLFNIVADSITIRIEDPNNTAWEAATSWSPESVWSTLILYTDFSATFGSADYAEFGNLWLDFATFGEGVRITLTFKVDDAALKTISAGVLVLGKVTTSAYQLSRPMGEGLRSYSIIKELNNGSKYVKKRDIVRTFSCSLLTENLTEFDKIMSVARVNGENPVAWKLVDSTDPRWVVYASFDEMPRGSHTGACTSNASFNLTEEL